MIGQEPIKGSLYPYLASESTLSREDLLIEHLTQFEELVKTDLWQSLFYPQAHDQIGDSEEKLNDSPDESSDTVDVSSSKYGASFDSDSEEENLASQKIALATAVKGENLQNEMLPRLRRPHSLERKAKLAVFFTVRGLLNRNVILFVGRSRSRNRSTRETVDSRN